MLSAVFRPHLCARSSTGHVDGVQAAAQTSARLDGVELSAAEEAFRSGALEGWNRAWAEHYASAFGTTTFVPHLHNSIPVLPSGEKPQREGIEEREPEEAPQFELSSEWVEFFARGEARRRELRAEGENEIRAEEELERAREEAQVPLFLGGARDSAARRRAENLYGPRADAILLAEARLDAAFQAAIGRNRRPALACSPAQYLETKTG